MRPATRIITLLLATVSLAGTGCIRRVKEPELLHANEPLVTGTLVDRINSYAHLTSFSGQASIEVKVYFATSASDKYPAGNLLISLQRPEKIRMVVTAPAPLTRDIADMTSDGSQFRLAVYYPTEKRAFIHGSNLGDYKRINEQDLKEASDPRLKNAGALANIRPQHVTEAFLIRPIVEDGRTDFFREELTQLEPFDRADKKSRLVRRAYYVLYVLDHHDDGKSALRRKFWFDRTRPGTPLVRQQTFENGGGKLGSDISYTGTFNLSGAQKSWPTTTVIERLNDGYSLTLELDPDSIQINGELPPTAFRLENVQQLKEIDLDQPTKAEADRSKTPQPPPNANQPRKRLHQ